MKRNVVNDLIVLSRITGLLEGLSSMEGAAISKKAAILLEEAAERLSIYIGDTFAEDVSGDEGTKEAFTDFME